MEKGEQRDGKAMRLKVRGEEQRERAAARKRKEVVEGNRMV